jgi:hypothetical protein
MVGQRTVAGDLDVMLVLPGMESFADLYARSIVIESMDQKIWIASIPDLIAMKHVTGRAKDLDQIEELESV